MPSDLVSSLDSRMDADSPRDAPTTPRFVRFGPFQIDRQRQQVYRGGTKLRLQGKVYQVLMELIAKQGEIVTREELKQSLWPADTHVNYDANVNTTLNKLRQGLGESTEKPVYIETIPRKGYSFIGRAEFSDAPFPQEQRGNAPADAAPTASSVVSGATPNGSAKWVTLVILGLVLAGILLGAGAAALWIAHFSPQLSR